MLKLIKKGEKDWRFIDSEIGTFSASKFTINTLNNVITVVYFNNLKSKEYNVSDCYIFDIGDTIGFNTSNVNDFMAKLEELNCPCFHKDINNFYTVDGVWGTINGDINDQTDLQNALDSKLDKDTTAGVERAYIINADGSQGTKDTSDFKDVLEFANLAAFPSTGETGIIYVALDTNFTYRWSGSAYVQIGGGQTPVFSYTPLVSHTGTTANTILSSITIPANTIKNGDVWTVEIVAKRLATNSTAAAFVSFDFNNPNAAYGPIRGVNIGNGARSRARIQRSFLFKNGYFYCFSNSGAFYTDLSSVQSEAMIPINLAINNTIYTCISLNAPTDIAVLDYVIFKKIN